MFLGAKASGVATSEILGATIGATEIDRVTTLAFASALATV